MNTTSLARLITFLLAMTMATAAKSSPSGSQEILAVLVASSKGSKGSLRSSKSATKKGHKGNSKKGKSDLKRMTLEARTTLLNVDSEELRDGESIFFEDT